MEHITLPPEALKYIREGGVIQVKDEEGIIIIYKVTTTK